MILNLKFKGFVLKFYFLVMLLFAFLSRVRKSIRTFVGDLDVAAVACGLGRAIGNKVTICYLISIFFPG